MTSPTPLPPELLAVLDRPLAAIIRSALPGCQAADVDDAIQNAHLTLLERWQDIAWKAPETDSPEQLVKSILSFLRVSARYSVSGRKAQQAKQREHCSDPEVIDATTVDTPSIASSPLGKAVYGELWDNLKEGMSLKDRLIVELLELGYTRKDIAAANYKDPNWANVRLTRLRASREALGKELHDALMRVLRGHWSGDAQVVPATLTARGVTAQHDIPASSIEWHTDGRLTAQLELPASWPASCLSVALLRLPTDKHLATAPFVLDRVGEAATTEMAAFLGVPSPGLLRSLMVPASSLHLAMLA